jgi:AcrR family transcriptional regulator
LQFFLSMANKPLQPVPRKPRRKPRTDAVRNRERILDVAKQAFTHFGASASLDDIARQAGVGAGTLYRHFPSRDALIEAVYRSEVEKLAAARHKFAETMPPIDALRTWMLLFVDHIAAKQIIAPALNSEARHQKRRHTKRYRLRGPASSVDRRLLCWLWSSPAAKRPQAGRHSHRRLTSTQIVRALAGLGVD